jgi:hypothetical protein
MLSGTAEESRARPLGMQSRKARIWRILPVAPTLGFSPLPPVQSAHLERVLWVDLTRSPGARRVTAPCAQRPSGWRLRMIAIHPSRCPPAHRSTLAHGWPLPFPSDAGRQDWAGRLPSAPAQDFGWIARVPAAKPPDGVHYDKRTVRVWASEPPTSRRPIQIAEGGDWRRRRPRTARVDEELFDYARGA